MFWKQRRQPDARRRRQTFVLEPILTPSGLIPLGDDGFGDGDDADLFGSLGADGADASAASDAIGATAGIFTVGDSGDVSIDFLFDGGAFSKGEVGIFSLEGLDEVEWGSDEFIQIAAERALSNSELGHVIIADETDAARFSGRLGEGDRNAGTYQGVSTVKMNPGEQFAFILGPNNSIQDIADGNGKVVFSIATANPDDNLQFGQVVDVTGDGKAFAFEDWTLSGSSDRDYNDIIIQVDGATGEAPLMDEMIAEGKDWRDSEKGWEILEFIRNGDDADDTTVDDGITDNTDVVTDDTVTVETPDTDTVADVVDDTNDAVNDTDDPVVINDDGESDTNNTVKDALPIQENEVVRDDWSVQEEDIPEQDDSHISDTVDEADIVDPSDQERTFDDDYDWKEDGFGNPGTQNYAPNVTGYNQSVDSGRAITPYFRVSDANGDRIERYYFRDYNTSTTSGYFTVNGVKQAGSFFVDAANLSTVKYIGGSQAGTESVRVYAYDGKTWGSDSFNITTKAKNYAPVVNLYNQTVSAGLSIAPTIRVSDANGDRIQRYYFRDYNSSSTSGYFTVNGVKQSNSFFIDADKLNTVRFVGGSQAGTDSVRIYAYDGKTWGSQSATYTTRVANRAPTITAYNYTINSGSSIAPYIRVSDPDGDRIQRYYFRDYNTSSTSGYFTVNGVRQSSGFYVDASKLNTVRFVGGSQAGTDSVRIYAYDGKTWGNKNVTYTTRVANRAPTVTASRYTLNTGSSVAPYIRVSDPDGDRIQRYYFRDYNTSSTSGYFTVNGVKQSGAFFVDADKLSTVRFVAGSKASTDSVRIYAYDGKTWGSTTTTYTTREANRAPTVTAYDQKVRSGSSIAPYFRVNDADGDRIQRYYFYDSNHSSTSGYYTVNGVKQTRGFFVDANKLSTVKYVGGSQAGKETLRVYAYDGKIWGSDTYTVETLRSNQAPVVTASNQKVRSGSSIVPFFRVSDADGDRIQRYYFSDYNQTSGSGYFTVNGVKQTKSFFVDADKLNTVRFVGGSQAGTDNVRVWASDGKTWGSKQFTIETERTNRAPIITATNQTVKTGASVTPYFRVSDPDGDRIQRYYFYDYNRSSTSGYFTVNGVKKTGGFSVTADQLSSVKFVGGSQASTDKVGIWAYDGQTWGHKAINMTTQKTNTRAVVNLNAQTVKRGQSIMPQFSVTDADGDKITRYGFYDSNRSSTSGYFTVNGVKQAAGRAFYVNADQLHTVKFVGGSAKSSDRVYINAFDGQDWSFWKNANITTQGGSAPVVVNATSQTVSTKQVIKPNFTVTDADGDTIKQYRFFDGNAQSNSGYFTVNGIKQTAGKAFYVSADKLDAVRFVGGDVSTTDSLYVSASDNSDGWSSWKKFSVTTKTTTQNDWFTQNIKDVAIRELARTRFQDGLLDRKDMIDIFNTAKDGNVVDSNEFSDLKALVNNTSFIKMQDHVRVLSGKVVNGNIANAKFQGKTVGNLAANSSASHLDTLVKEHFLGQDRPLPKGQFSYGSASNVKYNYAQGSLFQNGIQYTDVKQGALGDCYYLAGLAAVAQKTPNAIKEMFIDNGDGTYTVRLFNNGKADYVTVDRYLPTHSNGTLSFAKVGSYWNTYKNTNNELWVALAEKAYAQVNESKWIRQDGTNSYKGIEGGWMDTAIKHITDRDAVRQYTLPSSLTTAVNAFNSGKLVCFATKKTPDSNLAGHHAYTMVGYNSATQKVKLFNPWGIGNNKDGGHLELSWSQIQRNFMAWTYNK